MNSLIPFRTNASKPENPHERLIRDLIRDISSQLKPGRVESNKKLVKSLLQAALNGGLVDDKQYVPERFIQILASLPEDSRARDIGSGILLKSLWDNLQHPPLGYVGEPFKYRTADGSNNNVLFPHIGKSGSFYARSVTPRHLPTALPDPNVLFDTLLARRGPPKPHPSGISGLLFALATIIIHDLFRTDDKDPNIVAVSSYLDLSPLYGTNEETQSLVRTFVGGKLKADAFSEVRMLGQPPECSALLISFNRFHNFMVEELSIINEGGKFSMPSDTVLPGTPEYERLMKKRDNDLFQTARLVTCSLYMHIIVNDYFRTIINIHRTDSKWSLNPSKDYEEIFGHDGIEKGIGNQVSVEFNLIYRWHSAISAKNEKWLNGFFSQLFPGKKPKDLTQAEFKAGMGAWARQLPKDPGQRTFGGLQRNADGHFQDADLVRLLTNATEDIAAAFGPCHVPVALKAVEILSIHQSRGWGVATLNELRMQFGMIPHKRFLDINSDPAIASALQSLYGDVDNVELYPGVVVEEAKVPMLPGSGLCAGFTTTRAILSDAVTLVRGDRFYTIDYNPVTLTAFGINETASDPSVAGGGVLYRLLMRSFPRWYRANSIYAFFPFTIPSEMRAIKENLGQAAAYDWTRPTLNDKAVIVNTWKAATDVLLNPHIFKVPWGRALTRLSSYGVMLGSDGTESSQQRDFITHAIFEPPTTLKEIRFLFERVTIDLLEAHTLSLSGSWEIDVVRDVATLSWSRFAAQFLDIPIKNELHTDTTLDDRQLYELLQTLFQYVFLDTEDVSSFALHKAAANAFETLQSIIKPVLEQSIGSKKADLRDIFHCVPATRSSDNLLPSQGAQLLQRLKRSGKSADEITWWIVTLAFGMTPPGSLALSRVTDLFLQGPYAHHWDAIQIIARDSSDAAFEQIRRYTLEALRLTTPVGGVLRVAAAGHTFADGAETHQIQANDLVVVNVASASRDPQHFEKPDEILLNRPESAYMHLGYGTHTCLGQSIVPVAVASQLKVLAQLRNLRRAPGLQGKLTLRMVDGLTLFLTDKRDRWSPFPESMKLHFDSSNNHRARRRGLSFY
ncbi:heme peroxidase [Aaosphaeria arxii CBS 175.79]|uniref:Heme peroxidase n=1 Tax=Aaosphaeria arxii CBS 175.79 TaxID=1450172 RepID=A0A6A5Y661_9PLEO|nr:heme peroxidase [Aaosphaeria arxii CBS 175.79]KAF2020693.1 heme peroxidase [Aaosphaeria arxii CBS 175.79]